MRKDAQVNLFFGACCLALLCGGQLRAGAIESFDVVISHGEDHGFLDFTDQSRFLVEGGDIAHLDSYDSSYGEIVGGEQSHVSAFDQAEIQILGGVQSHVRAWDSSSVLIAGGTQSTVFSVDDANVVIAGGSRPHVVAENQSQLTFTGGSANSARARDQSELIVDGSGVSIGSLTAHTGTVIQLLSGTVHTVNAEVFSTVNIRGGAINGIVRIDIVATVNAYGSDFQLEYEGTNHLGVQHYGLTGVLEDGTPLDTTVFIVEHATLNLVTIPEPTALLSLSLCGLAGLSRRRRRSRL